MVSTVIPASHFASLLHVIARMSRNCTYVYYTKIDKYAYIYIYVCVLSDILYIYIIYTVIYIYTYTHNMLYVIYVNGLSPSLSLTTHGTDPTFASSSRPGPHSSCPSPVASPGRLLRRPWWACPWYLDEARSGSGCSDSVVERTKRETNWSQNAIVFYYMF